MLERWSQLIKFFLELMQKKKKRWGEKERKKGREKKEQLVVTHT